MIHRLILLIWRTLPPSVRSSFWDWYLKASLARPNRIPSGISPGEPVVVAGMFRTASGLGAWSRSTYRALKAAGYKVTAVDLSDLLSTLDFECDIPLEPFPTGKTGTLILHVNGPETIVSLRKLGLRRGRKWRVIGAWAWELRAFPPGWEKAFPYINEIWALSNFGAEAFRLHGSAPPVRILPIAISAPNFLVDKKQGKENASFTLLAMADTLSSFERKNPAGAIAAFKQAFGGRTDCRLIVKVRNLNPTSDEALILHEAIGESKNIFIVNKSLDARQHWALIASSDLFISLHRAEGFGIGPAEAMALGIPVVATAWSGNLYYSNTESAALVPYSLVPVSDECMHYKIAGAVWAEPDIEAAAQILRRLESDRSYGYQFAEVARTRIANFCGPRRVQALATQLLQKVPL